MKTNSFRKGNFTYYLNYNENENRYSFVVYVKIRSNKRKIELQSTRLKEIDISFDNIHDPVLDSLSEKNVEIIKLLIMDVKK